MSARLPTAALAAMSLAARSLAAMSLAGLSLAALLLGCGPRPAPPLPPPAPVPLHLQPACDLAPSAGVAWVLDLRPRELAGIAELAPAVALVVPEARFRTFARAHGGLDVRELTELCVARYREATLSVARAPFDPARIEAAFAERVTHPLGRAVEVRNPEVVRVSGEVNGEPQELVLFGREALAFEQGRAGPARAALAFARGKLHRASPALRSHSLAPAVALAGEAPVRLFAPGPFEGELARGLGGLIRASTALAVTARIEEPSAAPRSDDDATRGPRVAVRLVLLGAWGRDADAAAERLAAAAHVVAESPLGRLLGLDHPLVPPAARGTGDALTLEITLSGQSLARGLRDALDAEIEDILAGAPATSRPPAAKTP